MAHPISLTSNNDMEARPATPTSRREKAARNGHAPSLSCIVPCFNEADNLLRLLPALTETLSKCVQAWEVILVDDGSRDETPQVLAAWAMKPGIRVLRLSRNFGKEAALTAGLQVALGDAVMMMDADLQHSTALIPEFVTRWRNGADVIYAVRETRQDESAAKRLGTRLFYHLLNRGDRFQIPPDAGDFRLMDRAVVNALLSLPERNRFMKGLYAWVGFDAVAVPYTPLPRQHGRSHFKWRSLLKLSMDGLTAFTTWPLRAVSRLGFVLAVIALTYGGYLTVDYFLNGHVLNGWTTIVVGLMAFSGIQLISIGAVGAYVGRIFEEVKGRPLYIVQDDFGQGLKIDPR
jgi:polyisoprenyl-phosphate glycosyltransferase